jgi:hypothetical protein
MESSHPRASPGAVHQQQMSSGAGGNGSASSQSQQQSNQSNNSPIYPYSQQQPLSSSLLSSIPPPSASATNLRALIEAKSHELNVLGEYHHVQLAEENASLQQALHTTQQRYTRLKGDFEYNLTLLSQRDLELSRYDELSVTYARTLEQKQEEWRQQVQKAEAKVDEKSLQLSDLTETYNKLRSTYTTLQEQLSTKSWEFESEKRQLQYSFQQQLKEMDAKLQAKDELLSKNQYELMHNFEKASEVQASETQQKFDSMMTQIKALELKNEQSLKELQRTQERLAIEQHKRQSVEEKLNETNMKLLHSESREEELSTQLKELKLTYDEQVDDLTLQHSSLLKKSLQDFKQVQEQLDRVQEEFQRQQQEHKNELDQTKKEQEKLVREIHGNFEKQLKELSHNLDLKTQQYLDSTIFVSTLQGELDSYIQQERARTESLNVELGTFQSSHTKQIQQLNLTIWKTEEEKKSLSEKIDLLKKSLEDRRTEISNLKEQLSQSDRKRDELERKCTEIRLKSETESIVYEESLSSMKIQLKASQDLERRKQFDLESVEKNLAHQQAMIVEYQTQLKNVREELLQHVHSQSQSNSHTVANTNSDYPIIQQQFSEVGKDLESMGANMKGFEPFAVGMGGGSIPINMAPYNQNLSSQPSSARSYASQLQQQQQQQRFHFDQQQHGSASSSTMASPRNQDLYGQNQQSNQNQQPQLRPRQRQQQQQHHQQLYHSSDDESSSSQPQSTSHGGGHGHHQHNLSRISERSDGSSFTVQEGKYDHDEEQQQQQHKKHQRQLSNSDPTPTPNPSNANNAALSSTLPNPGASANTPTVKIVTALALNVVPVDGEHQAISIETPAPSRRSSQMKAARKQSITSPNINLNAAQASLESLVPQVIHEGDERKGGGGGGVNFNRHDSSDDSGSENDFVEQPLSDSSVDNSREFNRLAGQQMYQPPQQQQRQNQPQQHQQQQQQQQQHQQQQQQGRIVHSMEIHHQDEEDFLSAELVGDNSVQSNQQYRNNNSSGRQGNVTPPDARGGGGGGGNGGQDPYRPSTSQSDFSPNQRPVHSPRPYTPAFSEDMGPVSLPNSMPNSPMGARPNSNQGQGRGQQQHQMGQQHLSPPGQQSFRSRGNSSARQQHSNQIPVLPIPSAASQQYDQGYRASARGGGGTAGGNDGQDSQRSTQSTTSHTSSHVQLEKSAEQMTRENSVLKEQNASLSQIIREMKKELENLLLQQQKQSETQSKLDLQAATNLPPGTVPGTVSIPATQYKALQLQLQTQSVTLANQTKQLEEQRTIHQKLQFHHALLLAELESVQQHLPPTVLQQHISAELTFLRTYTRELNSTITNLKSELMYAQAQQQHSIQVLDSKHQQTILLHSQTQQLEQLQVSLQFKEHKLLELDAQLQSRSRETVELKHLLSEAQHRLAQLSLQAQQDNVQLKQHNEELKSQAVQQMLAQQQQQQAAAQAQAAAQQQQQPQVPVGQPQSYHPQQQQQQHPMYHPAYPVQAFHGPPYPSNYPAPPAEYVSGYTSGASAGGQANAYLSGYSSGGRSAYDDESGKVYPHHQRRSSAPHVHSPPESSRTDDSALTDLSLPPHPLRLPRCSRSASTSPARSRSRSRSRKRGGDAAYSDSGADDTHSIDLSLTGSTLQPSAGARRDVPFHASDRATASQAASGRSLRVRAEILKKKDAEVKARADAARARVREQMKRMRAVEVERHREALEPEEEEHKQQQQPQPLPPEPSNDQENNPWNTREPRSKRSSIASGESKRSEPSRTSSRSGKHAQ